MAAIKIVRRKNKQRKDGTAPLALRISQNYQTNYTFLGEYVLEKNWDSDQGLVKKSHPNSARVNNFLLKKLTKANDVVYEANDFITSKEVKNKIKNQGRNTSFFEVAAERIKNKYECGTYSVAESELSKLYNILEFINHKKSLDKEIVIASIKERRKKRMSKARRFEYTKQNAIMNFRKNKSLYFEDINLAFINKYKTFCIAYLGHKTRTVTNQLIFIRTLFNIAIMDGVVDLKYYPFSGDKEKIHIGSGLKIGLSEEEISVLESLSLVKGSSIWHVYNVWLLAFYFAGIRVSDLVKLKWDDFKDGRLYYVMNKNEKPLSLKIPEKVNVILNKYKDSKKENKGYVFPFLGSVDPKSSRDVFVKTRNATKQINKYLKRIATMCGIDKDLSSHIARHSFGNIAGDKIHPLMLQKLYRHSDLKTTLNYQANFIHKEADDALDAVINF